MQYTSLNTFLNKNEELRPYIIKTEGENSKWGRVVCDWHEKVKNKGEKVTYRNHIFTPTINLETKDMYLDCSKRKIYLKFIANTVARPFQIIFKTIYHAAIPISIPHIIYKTISKGKIESHGSKQIAKNCLKNSVKSLADIVRTPLYGVALTIVNIAALTIGPLFPKTLYDFREWTGKLVQSLYWHEQADYKNDISYCFQPLGNLETINSWKVKDRGTTKYDPSATDYIISLNNLAKANINFKRSHYNIFSSPCILDREITFISPSYGDVRKKLVSVQS